MNAWKAKLAGDKPTNVHFVADDQGTFASATGLIFDATAFLGGPRAKRAAIVVVSCFFLFFGKIFWGPGWGDGRGGV